ncbi:MAG: hypothetical protein LBM63_02315 [Rikenellaceae bacterium]|jgi:hypothetical protein|nr:hypothetical protein [Rikenellaceae bacterium]
MEIDDRRADRQILSTDNNEYAEGLNDENLWEEDILDTDVPLDDDIGEFCSTLDEHHRPLYSDTGFDENRIDE